MHHCCLSFSSLFLLIPIYFFTIKQNKNIGEIIAALLIFINIVFSFMFWLNPIEHSLIHFYDGIFGKISFVFISIYILFVKNIDHELKIIFLLILLFSLYMFYYSNENSQKQWCCKKHVICHIIFHILISVGCTFAFIDNTYFL
jgi:Ca2+/Na+ antiporter